MSNLALLEYIRNNLIYAPETGDIFWVTPKGHRSSGLAGTLDPRGYRSISFGKLGRHYYHRVAWYLGMGVWPEGVIDHIDRDKTNNRLDNLRDVPIAVNTWNRGREKSTGVRFRPDKGRWQAYVHEGNAFKSLGHFKCETSAYLARQKYNKERDESYSHQMPLP